MTLRPVSSMVAKPIASSTPAREGERDRGHVMTTQSICRLYASGTAELPLSALLSRGR